MAKRQKSSTPVRKRRSFTPEYKAGVLELIARGDRSIGQVCRDLDLTETAVRHWVNQAQAAGQTMTGSVTAGETERDELVRLRAEVKLLKMERDVLKKATILFATDPT